MNITGRISKNLIQIVKRHILWKSWKIVIFRTLDILVTLTSPGGKRKNWGKWSLISDTILSADPWPLTWWMKILSMRVAEPPKEFYVEVPHYVYWFVNGTMPLNSWIKYSWNFSGELCYVNIYYVVYIFNFLFWKPNFNPHCLVRYSRNVFSKIL